MFRLITAGCFLLALVACATLPSPQERQAHADALAAAHGWQAVRIPAGAFTLLAYVPPAIAPQATLTVYLEGDGFAWRDGVTPSSDPTPRDPLALRLAFADPTGNAIYLARPCQYADAEHSGCALRYWTGDRFAPEVIDATSRALDALKARFGASQLVLVGYSGGGAVAALLASCRVDVDTLVTVAGNLDHRAWTAHHRVEPLLGSLNAADVANRLKSLPQTHFVGANDKVIPPVLAQRWPDGIIGPQGANLRIIPDADHGCCWVDRWPSMLKSSQFDWSTPKSAVGL